MSEIEKCPLCGKDVKKSIWRPEYEGCAGSVVVTVRCCGMEAVGIKLWNQYAAAMELAKAEAAKAICSSKENPIEMGEAIKILEAIEVKKLHVIEVFNG